MCIRDRRDRRQSGRGERQVDRPEDVKITGAVYLRRFPQVIGYGLEEVPHQQDAEPGTSPENTRAASVLSKPRFLFTINSGIMISSLGIAMVASTKTIINRLSLIHIS